MAGNFNNLLAVRATHADGTTDNETFTLTRAVQVMDWCVIATNAGAGQVTLQNGAVPISAALNPSTTDTAFLRPATGGVWTAAQKNLPSGGVLTFVVSGAGLNYESYAYLYPVPAAPLLP